MTGAQVINMSETEQSPDKPVPGPVFGERNTSDFAPQTEQPEWLTIGEGAWMWDGPSWDQRRIRLGRIDKPTAARIIQRVYKPGKKPALEVIHPYTGKDGKHYETRFWVNINRNGFEGMPRKSKAKQPSFEL